MHLRTDTIVWLSKLYDDSTERFSVGLREIHLSILLDGNLVKGI